MAKSQFSKTETPATGAPPATPPVNGNLRIWSAVEKTNPDFTKEFKRGGGFSGTAINPAWLCKRATEQFGPVGKGWGWDIVEERTMDNFEGTARVWFAKVKVWYLLDGQRCETPEQWGATEILGKNKWGAFFDEEAPKKTITDALTKCLSYLGFAADVHMGLYEDNKYVAAMHKHFDEPSAPKTGSTAPKDEVDKADPELKEWRDVVVKSINASKDTAALKELWDKQKPVGEAYAKRDAVGKQGYLFVVSQMKRRAAELHQDDVGDQAGKGAQSEAAE